MIKVRLLNQSYVEHDIWQRIFRKKNSHLRSKVALDFCSLMRRGLRLEVLGEKNNTKY